MIKLFSWNFDVGKTNFGVEKSKHLFVSSQAVIARSLPLDIPLSAGFSVFSLRFWFVKPILGLPFACRKPDLQEICNLRNRLDNLFYLQLPV